jgi:uncharacterized phage-associated protein
MTTGRDAEGKRVKRSITTSFDERKTAVAAGLLLKEAGGSMPYIRLIKLLYLADRESWRTLGRPITGDEYFAMKYGPVLSRTLDLVKMDNPEGPWGRIVQRSGPHDVSLREGPDADLGPLSDAEIEILKAAHNLYRDLDRWKLCDLTHLLPEWSEPGKSSRKISPDDILNALGKSGEEIEDSRQENIESSYFEALFGVRA